MVLRSVCLCDGKLIGIESIYTVVNGKQINDPEKLKILRAKSRNKELFCACGCGANVILVAGEKGLRNQHFRIDGKSEKCTYTEESPESLGSKIVLNCWLDKNLQTDDIETRVQIGSISSSNRKYEFSFCSLNKKIALSYSRSSLNWSDEKFAVLRENSKGIHLYCITDFASHNNTGQFPESLIRMQEQQGYSLFLDQHNGDYASALLSVVWYGRDCDGVWQETVLADDALDKFDISNEGILSYSGKQISEMADEYRIGFEQSQKDILAQRELEQRQQQELAEKKKKADALLKKKRREQMLEEQRREAAETAERERIRRAFEEDLPNLLRTSTETVTDERGHQLLICRKCGQIRKKVAFEICGMDGKPNLGVCKPCAEIERQEKRKLENQALVESIRTEGVPRRECRKEKATETIEFCPMCGAKLVIRHGPYGDFLGCSNYPDCHFSLSLFP